MKRYVALLLALSLAAGCTETKRVVVDRLVEEPPKEKPTEPIPPIEQPGDAFLQNDEVEQFSLDEGLGLIAADAANIVWLSNANFLNNGDNVSVATNAVELGFNMLSSRQALGRCKGLGPDSAILACDLRDFFGSRASAVWKMIEDNAVIKIVPQTARYKNLQFITQKRIPLMHAQIFLETAFKAPVYYAIKQVPLSENEFWKGQGIDRQKQFDDKDSDIFLALFQESLIAPDHNREVRRMFGNQPCWNTYDVDALQIVDASNFFKFPFPVEARSAKTLIHNAGEILCLQPNGLYFGALYNAAGVRQDAAPTTVVVNTRAAKLGLDPSITLRDCAGCHTQFVLPVIDEGRRFISDNPFAAADKLIAIGTASKPGFFQPQANLDKIIAADNALHAQSLRNLDIEPGSPDPINEGSIDLMRDGYDAKELASFLYMTEGEFLTALAGSQKASNEVGQLLQGGTIGFIALQASIATIIDDLNLFKDE